MADTNTPVTVGIIGVSGFGDVHYKDLLREVEAGRFKAVAATVVNRDEEPEKCAKLASLGCEIYDDHATMLSKHAGGLTLCMIPTGIHLHAPMAIEALRAGANVFVEKPAAATIQDVDAMRKAAMDAGRFVAVGFQRLFDPVMNRVKHRLVKGEIGDIKSVSCRALWPRTDDYYARNGWAGRLKTGDSWVLDSPFNNALSHELAMILYLCGTLPETAAPIRSVQAELYRAHDIESADTCTMRIKTRRGTTILYAVTHASETEFGPEMRFVGRRGSLLLTHQTATFDVRGRGVEAISLRDDDSLRVTVADALVDRCRRGNAFICDLEIARAHTLVVNAVHDSAMVHAIDPAHVRRVQDGGSVKTVVDGVDAAMAKCANEMRLLSEVGVSWGQESHVFGMDGYDRFRGVACPQ